MAAPVLPHVIVCGGRDFADESLLIERLDRYTAELGKIVVVTGACPTGADMLAERWASRRHHTIMRFHADWDAHGKTAGPIRNREMCVHVAGVRDGFCVAFWDGVSRGTGGMIALVREHGIPLRVVRYESVNCRSG